jgi:SAM-dependent methyltransferase
VEFENKRAREVSVRFWDQKSRVHERIWVNGIHTAAEWQRWKTFLGEQFGTPPKSVLDAGAGTGVLSSILADLGYKVVAVDSSSKMCEMASEKRLGDGRFFCVVTGSLENLPFPNASFDAVVVRHVLGTLSDRVGALREFHRVLRRPGALLLIELEPTYTTLWARSVATAAGWCLKVHKDRFLFKTDDDFAAIARGTKAPGRVGIQAVLSELSKVGFSVVEMPSLEAILDAECGSAPLYHRLLARVTPRYAVSCRPI